MKQLYMEMNQSYETFLHEHEDLDKPIKIHHPKFGELDTSAIKMVNHIVNHGTYHRGNIAAMIRQHGHSGVSTDYIFYLYDVLKNTEQVLYNPGKDLSHIAGHYHER